MGFPLSGFPPWSRTSSSSDAPDFPYTLGAQVKGWWVLTASDIVPTPAQDETNEALVESVWTAALAGTPPREIESQVPVDAYRVRRLLGHWVEEGALAIR